MKVPLMMLVEIPPLCKKVEVNIKEEREILLSLSLIKQKGTIKMKNKKLKNLPIDPLVMNVYIETITKMLQRGKIPTITIKRYGMLLNKCGLNK